MPNFKDILKSEQAAQLMGQAGKLEQLKDAPETRRLFQLLSQSSGDLAEAADRAAQGDAGQLTAAIRHLMQDSEGKALIEHLKKSLK